MDIFISSIKREILAKKPFYSQDIFSVDICDKTLVTDCIIKLLIESKGDIPKNISLLIEKEYDVLLSTYNRIVDINFEVSEVVLRTLYIYILYHRVKKTEGRDYFSDFVYRMH